jgi:hypothetical protein
MIENTLKPKLITFLRENNNPITITYKNKTLNTVVQSFKIIVALIGTRVHF